jgi:hypothetical protein
MITLSKTYQVQGRIEFVNNSNDTLEREVRSLLLLLLLCHKGKPCSRATSQHPTSVYSGYAPSDNGEDTLSEMTHEKKCQPQGGTESSELERRTATPTLVAPMSSVLTMLTPVETCQSQGGTELESDNKGTPTTFAPQSSDSGEDNFTG